MMTTTMNSKNKFGLELLGKRHEKFLGRILYNLNPELFTAYETNRMTLVYFCVVGLDLLKCHESSLTPDRKIQIIKWIKNCYRESNKVSGFYGSLNSVPFNRDEPPCGHLALTYSALLSLFTLRDDLKGIDRIRILSGIRSLQLPHNGSFTSSFQEEDYDMRFVYCASAISYMLNDWETGMNKEAVLDFIKNSLTYEGGFGQRPGSEAHGGSTFCAVASLYLMGELNRVLSPHQLRSLKRWVSFRMHVGFQGRPNKPSDTCYSWWVGATLKMLDLNLDYDECIEFTLSTQEPIIGGFSKWPENSPDPLHTYFGLGGLSIMSISDEAQSENPFNLNLMHPALNTTYKTHEYILKLHQSWKKT